MWVDIDNFRLMTQGVYRSPKCFFKTNMDTTSSPFELDFIAYLNEYRLYQLKPIVAKLKQFDWSPCKVSLYKVVVFALLRLCRLLLLRQSQAITENRKTLLIIGDLKNLRLPSANTSIFPNITTKAHKSLCRFGLLSF